MTARRVITIGAVTEGFVSLGSWGGPGWKIEWRGRVEWCQPWQFIRREDLLNAVDLRLRMAGLKAVRFEYDPRQNDGLRVLVRRARGEERRIWEERKARRQ